MQFFLEPGLKQAVCLGLLSSFFLEEERKSSRSSPNAFKQQEAEEVEEVDAHTCSPAGPALPRRKLRLRPGNCTFLGCKDSRGASRPYHRENSDQHEIHVHFQRLLPVRLWQYVRVQLAVGGDVQVLDDIVVRADVPGNGPCWEKIPWNQKRIRRGPDLWTRDVPKEGGYGAVGMESVNNPGKSLLKQARTEVLKAFPALINLPVPRERVRIAIKARCIFSCFQIRRRMAPRPLRMAQGTSLVMWKLIWYLLMRDGDFVIRSRALYLHWEGGFANGFMHSAGSWEWSLVAVRESGGH